MLVSDIFEVRATGRNEFKDFTYDQLENGKVKVNFPDGTSRVVDGQAEARRASQSWLASDRARTPVADPEQRSGADRGDSETGRQNQRGDGATRREPSLNRNPNTTRPSTTPADAMDQVRALHPEVPTQDQLTPRERTRYNRGQSFTRTVRGSGGQRMILQITPDMVDEQTRIRNARTPDIRSDDRRTSTDPEDRPASRDRNPKPARAGIIRRLLARLAQIGGGTIGTIVNTALTAVEVEEELDRMLRVVQSEIQRQEDEGVAPEDITWTDAMEEQYRETIDDLVELTFKGIVTLLATASASSLIVIALASIIGTGGTSIILGLIAGGIIGFFGTEALYQVLEYAGVMDMVENFIADEWLTPSAILALAAGVDVIQNMPLVPGDDPTSFGDEDDLTDVTASTDYSTKNQIKESSKPSEKEVVNKLRDMITGNPELLAIYNKGKAKAKSVKAELDQGHS